VIAMRTEHNFDHISQAFVRKPGKNFMHGVCPAVGIPDVDRALTQHAEYCAALQKCGVEVKVLRTDPQFPDGAFISDMAVIIDNVAILSNFSDASPRQGEQQSVASILAGSHFLKFIQSPGRLDAADVLQIRDHIYIGLSDHTNPEGAAQLAYHLKDFGYQVTILDLEVENIVRMAAAGTYLGRDRILIREELARNYAFLEYEKIIVPASEKGAANACRINGTLLLPAGYSATAAELRLAGIPFIEVAVSEFEKMNGGLSCLSLRLPAVEKGNVVLMPQTRKARVA
jgi:dimethylargininase